MRYSKFVLVLPSCEVNQIAEMKFLILENVLIEFLFYLEEGS